MNSEAMPVNISKVRNDLRWKAAVTGPGFVAFVFALCAIARGSLTCVVTMQWSEIGSLTFMAVTRSGWLVA